jgi:pantoate--beta-alanine ligase
VKVVETPAEARAQYTGTIGVVPTMGALHGGHLSLLATARSMCDTVVMSLFVNPLQFDQPSDLASYPRDFDRDACLAEEEGVDVLFAPSLEVMFPEQLLTSVTVAGVTEHMEGVHRPGHFAGVATVVAKLLAALRPDMSFFGRKDHQQLVMVRTLAADLSFPGEIIGCPIIRDPDGLALSSRNMFIEDRDAALSISRGLMAAADAVDDGTTSAARLEGLVRRSLAVDTVDYVTLASQSRAQPMATLDRPAFLAVAARVGPVRLIDNLPIDLVGEMWVPDRGVGLDETRTSAS